MAHGRHFVDAIKDTDFHVGIYVDVRIETWTESDLPRCFVEHQQVCVVAGDKAIAQLVSNVGVPGWDATYRAHGEVMLVVVEHNAEVFENWSVVIDIRDPHLNSTSFRSGGDAARTTNTYFL